MTAAQFENSVVPAALVAVIVTKLPTGSGVEIVPIADPENVPRNVRPSPYPLESHAVDVKTSIGPVPPGIE